MRRWRFLLIFSFYLNSFFSSIFCHIVKDEEIPLIKAKVTIPCELSEIGQILTQVCLGTPPQCFMFKVATNINESFILDSSVILNGFKSDQSSTFYDTKEKIEFNHVSLYYSGTIAQETLSFPNSDIFIQNFSFYLITKGFAGKRYIGVLGLGKNYVDNKFSILSMLYMNDFIHNQIFSIKIDEDEENGYLTLGYHDTTNKKRFKATEIIGGFESPTFDTVLDGIIYYNKENDSDSSTCMTYHSPQVAYFSPGANKIYCPAKFFSFLTNQVFKKYIETTKICYTQEEEGNYLILRCSKEILSKDLGYLKFIFGKWNVEFNLHDLFLDMNGKLCNEIVFANDETKWIFGTPFIKQYSVIFNGDINVIELETLK